MWVGFFIQMQVDNIKEATEVAINVYEKVDLNKNTHSAQIYFNALGQILRTLKESLNNVEEESPTQ